MHPGDLSSVSSSLHFALKSLKQKWDETQEEWNDSVRQRFDENYVEPIEPQVSTVLKAINRLSKVISQACEECS